MIDNVVFRIPFTSHVLTFKTNLAIDAIAFFNLFSKVFG